MQDVKNRCLKEVNSARTDSQPSKHISFCTGRYEDPVANWNETNDAAYELLEPGIQLFG